MFTIKDKIIKYKEYQEYFRNKQKRREALKQALDIRKFEIDMYWKRATYFWAFIAAAFAAYFVVLASKDIDSAKQNFMLFLICGLGFMFSFSWLLVNKGSKFWQQNWENHVDFLEDDMMGPLYKIVIERNGKMTKRRYSVSKVNLILSSFFTWIWAIMGAEILGNIFIAPGYFARKLSYFGSNERGLVIFVLLFLLIFIGRMFFYARTSNESKKAVIRFRQLPSEEINENNNPDYEPRSSKHGKRIRRSNISEE